ncbi:condensin subunit ScpA [Ligilactobacillus sp. WC1T17]|uniref:Segregation and condensation protein A n=1 Tax=Ligilactobacillus ruminis TaxID=1623 RepID=A0ABY1ABK1_9LACO|nr:condensin subunit ScpA [Ligilactobacillus ruminis]
MADESLDMRHLTFKLPTFEGPLDLLLHLIRKNEMDIYDIKMSEITSQYIAYLHQMQELELDIAGEYLLIAAMLINIKSKMLLPTHQEDDFNENTELEDPREELVMQLILHQTYQKAAENLRTLADERSLKYMREPQEPSKEALKLHLDEQGQDVKLLEKAFARLLLKRKAKTTPQRRVSPEKYRLNEILPQLKTRIAAAKEPILFEDLFAQKADVELIVTTFMAMLELMKQNELRVMQAQNFGAILITGGEKNAV